MSFSEPIEQTWDLSTLTKIYSVPVNFEKLSYSYILFQIDKPATARFPKEIQQMVDSQHDGETYSIVFSSNDKTLITSGKDAKIRI